MTSSFCRLLALIGVSSMALLACPPVVNLPDGGEDNAFTLTPEGGGPFIRNGYAFEVPRNAVTGETRIFFTRVDTGIPDIPGRKRISPGWRISPTNLRFQTPVKLYLSWDPELLVRGVDPGTYDMRRQTGNESFMNPLPGSRTNTTPFEAVEATTDRLGLFWLTSPSTPNIDRLEVEPEEATLRVGETQQFTARVVAPNGDAIEAAVTWSVLPPRVASIDMTGKVTALDPGTATVTARVGMKTDTAKVFVVRDPPLAGPTTASHDNPFPTGNDLWGGALAPGGLGTIFVGENGTVLARSSSDQWQRLFSGPGLSFRAVGGTTPQNAIAVGLQGTTGVTVEFRGTTQPPRVRVFPPNNISELSTLWFDGTFGMTAGSGNNLLAYRDGGWVEENNPTLRRVMSITGDGRGAFAVVNELGSIYRYDPARRVWDSLFERELAVLLKAGQILDATTGESWAVGGGRLWRFTNGGWTAINLPASLATADFTAMALFDDRLFLSGRRAGRALVAAWVPPPTPPPAVDGGGSLDAGVVDPDAGMIDPDGGVLDGGALDGGAGGAGFTEFTLRGPQQPRGIFGGGPRSPIGYVVGDFGAVWEWDATGKTFIEKSRGFYGDVADIAATPTDVFVSVNECVDVLCTQQTGSVLHQGPNGWEPLGPPQPFSRPVHAIVARGGMDVIVDTDDGVFRWDMTQWRPMPTSRLGPIRDLKWCGGRLVGAGDNGAAYFGDTTGLTPSEVAMMGDLHAVSCPNATEIWVAGDALLVQRTGQTWTPRESMMIRQGPWRTVYAPGGGEAWAFGDARFGVYWDTANLSLFESFPIPMDVATASWGSSVDNLYMVGFTNPPIRFGFMMRFDGVQWRLIDSGSQRRVTAIDGFTTMQNGAQRTTLWLGTVGGGVLRSVQP